MTGISTVSDGVSSFISWATDPAWVAWAAGIYEGEGSVSPKSNRYGTPTMTITMTDEDTLRRFWTVVGCGNFSGPHFDLRKPHYKPFWRWSLGGRDPVWALGERFEPYLGRRRWLRMREVVGNHDRLREIRLAEKGKK